VIERVPKTAVQAGILVGAKFLAKLISFFAFIFVVRKIGPEHFGVYTYLVSLAMIVLPFASLGMGGNLIRLVKKKGEDLVDGAFLTYLASALVFVGGTVILVLYKGYSGVLAFATGAYLLVRAFYDLGELNQYIKGRVRFVTIASVGERLLFTVLVFLLPAKTSSLFIASVGSLGVLSIYLFLTGKVRPKFEFNLKYYSLAFFSGSFFLALGERLPSLIYESRFGIVALGIFGAALTLHQAGMFVFMESYKFLLVRLGFMKEDAEEKYKKILLLIAGFLLVAVLVGRPLLVWAGNLIYGASYVNVGQVFANLMLAAPALVLMFYPRSKLVYDSPRVYLVCVGVYAVGMVLMSLIVRDIVEASLGYALVAFLGLFVWWGVLKKGLGKPQ